MKTFARITDDVWSGYRERFKAWPAAEFQIVTRVPARMGWRAWLAHLTIDLWAAARELWREGTWASLWGYGMPPIIVVTTDDDWDAKRAEILDAFKRWNTEPMVLLPDGCRMEVIQRTPIMLRFWY